MSSINLTKKTADAPPNSRQVAKGVQAHLDQAAATELSRNALSREKYQFLLRVTTAIAVSHIVMTAALVYFAVRPVEERFIRTDSQGRLTEIQVLDRPIQSNQEVIHWVTRALTSAYTLSFANYGQQLNDVKQHFTSEGWESFNQALTRAGFLENLVNGKFITSAVPARAATVVAEGIAAKGVFGWRVQVPIIISYESAGVQTSQSVMIEATVVRRPATENPSGLGIYQLVAQ